MSLDPSTIETSTLDRWRTVTVPSCRPCQFLKGLPSAAITAHLTFPSNCRRVAVSARDQPCVRPSPTLVTHQQHAQAACIATAFPVQLGFSICQTKTINKPQACLLAQAGLPSVRFRYSEWCAFSSQCAGGGGPCSRNHQHQHLDQQSGIITRWKVVLTWR